MAKEHIFRRLKSQYTVKCMFGQCENCSGIIDGQGYHDIEVYQIYKTIIFQECDECKGRGVTEEPCDECDGTGNIFCPDCRGEGAKESECEICHGQKEFPVETEAEFIKTETVKK
jgi:DnaJ-class molecular chaperone